MPPPALVREADWAKQRLFRLHRILGAEPFAPAALEGIHLRETVIHHFACQTGTGVFVGSGAVQHIFFIFGQTARPVRIVFGFDVGGALDFELR